MLVRLPAFGEYQKYRKEEKQQMFSIQDAFKRAFGDRPLPPELIMEEDEFPSMHPAADGLHFEVCALNLRGCSGALKAAAQNLVQIICAYQSERHSRSVFESGYLDEPIQLFLELVKGKLYTLAGAESNQDLLTELEKWLKFFSYLLVSKTSLPEFVTSREKNVDVNARTFYATLLEIENVFKYRFYALVEAEIANQSARDIVREMNQACDSALNNAVAYLAYVLRESEEGPAPKDLQADILFSSKKKVHDQILSTYTGQCLFTLANAIREFTSPDQPCEKNPFLIAPQQSNHSLISSRQPHMQQANLSGETQNLLCLPKSGLSSNFRAKSSEAAIIRDSFLSLHAFFIELARLRRAWGKAYTLSGIAGNLGVFGFANARVQELAFVTESLVGKIKQELEKLHRAASDYYRELYASNSKAARYWRENFRMSWTFHESLLLDLKKLSGRLNIMREKASQATLGNLMHELEEGLKAFDEASENAIRRVWALSGVQVPMELTSESGHHRLGRFVGKEIHIRDGRGTLVDSRRVRSLSPTPQRTSFFSSSQGATIAADLVTIKAHTASASQAGSSVMSRQPLPSLLQQVPLASTSNLQPPVPLSTAPVMATPAQPRSRTSSNNSSQSLVLPQPTQSVASSSAQAPLVPPEEVRADPAASVIEEVQHTRSPRSGSHRHFI